MVVPCEGPVGMTPVGATGACPGTTITPRSHGPTALSANWEGTKSKAVGLSGASEREGLRRLGYLVEKIKLLVDPMGTVDTVRRDKSFPGSKK